jgi:hypothetical protein
MAVAEHVGSTSVAMAVEVHVGSVAMAVDDHWLPVAVAEGLDQTPWVEEVFDDSLIRT